MDKITATSTVTVGLPIYTDTQQNSGSFTGLRVRIEERTVEPFFKGQENALNPAINKSPASLIPCNPRLNLISRKAEHAGIDQKFLKTLEHIIISEKMSFDDIPMEDVFSMLRALNFSDISLNDPSFDQYNIKIIKTGAVLFTWYALKQTPIFNGANNFYQYDYVGEIIQVAKRLEKINKPVVVIYSNANMSEDCIKEMSECFLKQPNIITLCVETDLEFRCVGESNLRKSDSIRVQALYYHMEVLQKAKEKAFMKTKKHVVYKNLKKCEMLSFIYSDMDNIFKRYPDYILAFDGVIDAPEFGSRIVGNLEAYREKYPLLCKLHSPSPFFVGQLSEKENEAYQLVQKYIKIDQCSAVDSAVDGESKKRLTLQKRKIFDQLTKLIPLIIINQREIDRACFRSGSLQEELDKLKDNTEDMNSLKSRLPRPEQFALFYGDNGLLGCTPKNQRFEHFYKYFISVSGVLLISFHHFENNSNSNYYTVGNCHFMKANHLLGYQLIDSILIGSDSSWCDDNNTKLTYSSEHEQISIEISPDYIEIKINGHDNNQQFILRDYYNLDK